MTHSRKQGRSSRSACKQDVCAPGATWRVFVAIDLPAEVRRHITLHAARLREQLPEVHASWNREENIHLTLKFLGDLPISKVEALSRAAERAAGLVQPFELRVEGCGSFPPHGAPRVLWIGIDDPTGNAHCFHCPSKDNQ